MSIKRSNPNSEELVRNYLAKCGGVSPDKIAPDFTVIGFQARAAVKSVVTELAGVDATNDDTLQQSFEGNKRYSVAYCANYIRSLVKRNL
ncbi:MAG: hypothetical protein ABID64_05010 [Nitrospirota bacterium]